MNRRNFFQMLGGAAPLLFLPKLLDPVRWKVLGPSGIMVPNPAYLTARYEFLYGGEEGYWSFDRVQFPERSPDIELTDPRDHYPMRYSLIHPVTFMPVKIEPFICKPK